MKERLMGGMIGGVVGSLLGVLAVIAWVYIEDRLLGRGQPMPDTDRYREWVALLSASDTVLVQLVLIAVAAVFTWERLRTFGEPWRGRLRMGYISVALGFLLVQLVTTRTALVVMVAALVLSVVGRAVWVRLHRRQQEAIQ